MSCELFLCPIRARKEKRHGNRYVRGHRPTYYRPKPPTAHIWQQTLSNAGIRSQVVGDYLDAGIGDIPGVQPEIWVHRDDLERAKEVLRESRETDTNAAADAAPKE